MNEVFLVLLILASGTWFAAAIGAAIVSFYKKKNANISHIILGFAAGIILAVSLIELLYPSIHAAEDYSSLPAWIVVPGGFAIGFLGVLIMDIYIKRIKTKREKMGKGNFKYRQSLLLTSALSMHNLPEGFALGVILGALGAGGNGTLHMADLWAVVPLAIAIGLHKLPEGAVIAVSFTREGMQKLKSFFIAQISGFIGFISGIAGFMLVANLDAVLPYAMSIAGGAMVWVAVHELIPESRKNESKNPYLATIGVVLGIMAILLLDSTIGHGHAHGHLHHEHSHVHSHDYHDHDHHHDYHDHDDHDHHNNDHDNDD